jgi:hypothetical protein
MRLVLDTNVLVTAFRSRTGAAAEVLRLMKTADYFAKRAARADFAVFDRLMRRCGGEAPRPDDESPKTYRRRKAPGRRSPIVT